MYFKPEITASQLRGLSFCLPAHFRIRLQPCPAHSASNSLNYRPILELDEWLRRRVRMCYWKQWRLCRTKISHLLALGVSLRTAIIAGVGSKSYWRLSRSKATQVGMSNEWLKAQGLVSIRALWMKAQGYA